MHTDRNIYKFDHPNTTVRVNNVNSHSRQKILELFHSLIGDIRSVQDKHDASGKYLEIAFFSQESARKALCMSGYTISGAPLAVIAATPQNHAASSERRPDIRRNLYVLGLPFALTKTEFTNIFSRYGVVTHSVILATVDNSSRRRGFVVMSTHEEAKNAMAALTRTQIRGHILDISWAVVQRSQGFLDGGDRNMLLESKDSQDSLSTHGRDDSDLASANTSDTSIGAIERDLGTLTMSLIPTTTLLVTHLPTILFSQIQDLRPLFFPYGHILKLDVIQRSPHGFLVVLVHYETATAAHDAKQNLQGQYYGDMKLEACFVRTTTSTSTLDMDQGSSAFPCELDLQPNEVLHHNRSGSGYSTSSSTIRSNNNWFASFVKDPSANARYLNTLGIDASKPGTSRSRWTQSRHRSSSHRQPGSQAL